MTEIEIVLHAVYQERRRQEERWGVQHHPDATGLIDDDVRAERIKALNDFYDAEGNITWRDILLEEVYEAFAETDLDKLREELIQVAAVAVAWIEDIDGRRRS